MTRKTKIICTIGPSSESFEVIRRLTETGMDVARINFSHGDRVSHLASFETIHRAANQCGRTVAVLGDLQGPKIRVGKIGGSGQVDLVCGARLVISPDVELGTVERVGVSFHGLARNLEVGDTVLLDDGLLRLTVEAIEARDVHCRVEVGGPLSSHKGLNLPGVKVNLPALTEKDERDLAFMLEHGFDYAALSFVQSADDVRRVKDFVRRAGGEIKVVAKIEKPAALDQLAEILEEADGVMVARGDLGVELNVERVPAAQKRILRSAAEANVLAVTATQMLDSMIRNPVPTRAEASDVANAVFDGTDALMLSGETAVGAYPVEAAAMAASIALEAERETESWSGPYLAEHRTGEDFQESICHAAALTARDQQAAAIVVGTQTGRTALLMSKFRPAMPIIGISADQRTVRRMAAMHGVYPVCLPRMDDLEESVTLAVEHLISAGFACNGDMVVMTFGAPLQGRGRTNTLRLIRVGEQNG